MFLLNLRVLLSETEVVDLSLAGLLLGELDLLLEQVELGDGDGNTELLLHEAHLGDGLLFPLAETAYTECELLLLKCLIFVLGVILTAQKLLLLLKALVLPSKFEQVYIKNRVLLCKLDKFTFFGISTRIHSLQKSLKFLILGLFLHEQVLGISVFRPITF